MLFKKRNKKQEPILLKGRKTMPSIRCTDAAFKYVPAVHTDLAARFRAERERMGVSE